MANGATKVGGGVIGAIGAMLMLVVSVIAGYAWGCPQYNVYRERMAGEARLAEAESSRQILVREAEAKRDSAAMLAEAEVARAKGVAQANEIIGESLKGNEAYLRYLWIQGLQDGSSEVVYVPTEAGLPILEAGRMVHRDAIKYLNPND